MENKNSNISKRHLTDKQEQFVKIYVESDGQLSKTECAKLAGYDDKSAYQRAYELTHPKHCPNVVEEIVDIKPITWTSIKSHLKIIFRC